MTPARRAPTTPATSVARAAPTALAGLVLASSLLLSCPGALRAQGGAAPDAEAPRDPKKGDVATFPLGPLGADGEILADTAVITLIAVAAVGPAARAGLVPGDRLVGVAGRPFAVHTRKVDAGGKGPMADLGRALGRAVTGEGPLVLDVLTAGESDGEGTAGSAEPNTLRRVTIELPARTPWADDPGADCPRRDAFLGGIAQKLRATQQENGSWRARTGDGANRYVSALCGLALLAHGDPADLDRLRRLADYLAMEDRKAGVSDDHRTPEGLSNWWLCGTGIFLAEFTLATGERTFVPTIQHLVDTLAARQDAAGKYGHGIHTGYSGRGFNVINTHAHLLWALGEKAGCTVDDDAWRRSLEQIRLSTGDKDDRNNGGVRYWTSQTGYWDACVRTGQMALALDIRDAEPELRARMLDYLTRQTARMREAHAMGSIGMIFGTAALRRGSPEGWRTHLDEWRWYLELAELPDRSAGYIGGKRNNGGDHYLDKRHVGNAIVGMMLASGPGRLCMFGGEETGWLKPPAGAGGR